MMNPHMKKNIRIPHDPMNDATKCFTHLKTMTLHIYELQHNLLLVFRYQELPNPSRFVNKDRSANS